MPGNIILQNQSLCGGERKIGSAHVSHRLGWLRAVGSRAPNGL